MAALSRTWSVPPLARLESLHGFRVAFFSSSTVFGNRTWSNEDLELARELQAKEAPLQEWLPRFPDRDYRSVARLRIRDLDPQNIFSSRRQWTAAEITTLRALKARNADSKELLQALPGRSPLAINYQWRRNGPRDGKGELLYTTRRFFTPEEYQLAKDCRDRGMTLERIRAEHFPHRSTKSISTLLINGAYDRASRRPWTEEDLARLHQLRVVEKLPYQEIASIMNRSYASVHRTGFDVLQGQTALFVHSRKWSDEESSKAQSLRQAGSSLSAIASALGRSYHSVGDKLRSLKSGGK